MIAPEDSTASTMIEALGYSINALDAAAELDVDRTDDDRAFFAAEKATLLPLLDNVTTAEKNLGNHILLVMGRLKARILVGDAVLDRGVRAGKKRMALDCKDTKDLAHVFPDNIEDIVDARRQVEPGLVLELTGRLDQVADFTSKATLKDDLEGRAKRQKQNFDDRDKEARSQSGLEALVDQAVARGSVALYRLEKRLLDRFPKQKVYVAAFFLDVSPPRRKAAKPTTTTETTGTPPAAPPGE